jgi:hypothetical protein
MGKFRKIQHQPGLNEKQIKGIAKRIQKNKAVALQWINFIEYKRNTMNIKLWRE